MTKQAFLDSLSAEQSTALNVLLVEQRDALVASAAKTNADLVALKADELQGLKNTVQQKGDQLSEAKSVLKLKDEEHQTTLAQLGALVAEKDKKLEALAAVESALSDDSLDDKAKAKAVKAALKEARRPEKEKRIEALEAELAKLKI